MGTEVTKPALTAEDIENFKKILEDAQGHRNLTDWENNFVADMLGKIIQYGERTLISIKQEAVIRKIEGKIYGIG